MKRIRKNLKKRSGKALLSLLLAAALAVGGMTTALATEEDVTTETDVTEDVALTEAAAVTDAEGTSVSMDQDGSAVTGGNVEEADTPTLVTGDTTETGSEDIVTYDAAKESDGDTETADVSGSAYGLYGGYDGLDSMDDPDTAGSCVGWDLEPMSAITSDSGLWWIDDYYISESAPYDTEKTDDFSLKYQVEFHTSEDIDAGNVKIVISASLGKDRNGNNILPTELGIPYGTPDSYTAGSTTPFNYYYFYYDENGEEVILTADEALTTDEEVYMMVWNYRDIDSGSNAMFQVLYKNEDVMQIIDETEWDITVEAEVDIGEEDEPYIETVEGNTLHGIVDTTATLSSATKSYSKIAYNSSTVNSNINGSIPEPYASDFDDYIYIVWTVTVKGTATQPYTVTFDENTFIQDSEVTGSVVGFKRDTSSSTSGVSVTYGTDEDGNPTISFSSSTARSFSEKFYVVTAYSKEEYDALVDEYGQSDVKLENDIEATVTPVDGIDSPTTKEASATTTWTEYVEPTPTPPYHWHYAGNSFSISKTGGSTYAGYMELYDINSSNGVDTGAFSFSTSTTNRGYGLVRLKDDTVSSSETDVWDWIEGAYYTVTTVDDALYAHPNGDSNAARMLTQEDYYFSSVTVTTRDYGINTSSGTTTSGGTYDDIDQDVYIYAMFAKEEDGTEEPDEDGWELVGSVDYSASSNMVYTFTSEQLAREPYRVKAVHSTANYQTNCTIAVGVMIRANSPVLTEFKETYGEDLTSLKIENISGFSGQVYGAEELGYEEGYYYQNTATDGTTTSGLIYSGHTGNDEDESLADFTDDLYDTILQRDNSSYTWNSMSETSAAYKTYTTENDAANGRVLVNYMITAYEGYTVVSQSTVNTLKEAGYSLPDRSEVTFYDLLPYGMEFNANATVTAGRISSMNSSGTWRTNPNAWDKTDVSVTVDYTDVIANWNGTGRTMVAFHISYSGDSLDAYYSNSSLWYQGYGISFQAYFDWADADTVDSEYNIAAYVAENVEDESDQLLGKKDSTVWKDDGSVSLGSQYEPFEVADLNGDGITDLYTNMYASTSTSTGDMAIATTDTIKKTVRADADAVAEYGSTTAVADGAGYTYEISIQNAIAAKLTDIVIFDRLEYAVEDGRDKVEIGSTSVYNGLPEDEIKNHWTGTFNGLTLTAADDLGIAAVIYYSASSDATIPAEDQAPSEVLTEANGWYEASVFLEEHELADVKAVAVDLSTLKNGNEFELEGGESITIQIHMLAPEGLTEEQIEAGTLYAFNNSSYYSTSYPYWGDPTSSTDSSNSTRVALGEAGQLAVSKEFDPSIEVPASLAKQKFTFELVRQVEMADGTVQEYPLGGQEYMIYEYDTDTDEWESTGVIHATDVNGQFTLQAGQVALFSQLVDAEQVKVTELENVLWDSAYETGSTIYDLKEVLTYTYTNTYRSPVYFYKTALTTDLATEEELAEAEFTFRIMLDTDGDGVYETPYANGDYVYVTEVLTNGASPDIDTTKGDAGHGTTDEDGYVTLHIGDIIAFFPSITGTDGTQVLNVPYQITEVTEGDAWNDAWVTLTDPTASGATIDFGTSETITNYYKYRNLILTKSLLDYDEDESACEDEWTFQLQHEITTYDEDGNPVGTTYEPVAGNHWYMIDANGNAIAGAEGTLDDNGCFTFTGAGSGRRVVVEGLVEGEKYTLTEIAWDEDSYEQVNYGTVDVTMPVYSITRSAEITNKFLWKDLSVEKLVLTDEINDDIQTYTFTFTLEKYDPENADAGDDGYVPVPGATYTIDGVEYQTDANGQFTLCHGETAFFDDLGYQEDIYRVIETEDGTYKQIYPAENAPFESALGSDGASIRFINGDFKNVATLTKSLTGLDEVGEAYVDLVKKDNTAATLAGEEGDVPYTVKATFGVYDVDNCVTEDTGALIDYESNNEDYPYVYIKINADGTYTVKSYNGGVITEDLAPFDYIYIAEIGEYTVKVSESAEMERLILDVTEDTEEAIGSESILSEGSVMSGSAAANDQVTLVNNISSAHKASEIYKLMSDASEEVPAGSEITFIVEVYDAASGTWSPASGIRYITMEGYNGGYDTSGCVTTSGVLTTGSNGQITLTKTENGYPYIRFIDDEVYANVYEDMADGTLRIVELASGTDGEWGTLHGYDSQWWLGETEDDKPSLNITYADTFVDANDGTLLFDVEKEMVEGDEDCDEDFTFQLVHVLASSTSPITSMSQITDSEVGAGVAYQIFAYDADTDEWRYVGDGVTDANGCFTLKPGQFAQFTVPEDTVWYVYEGIMPGYLLDSVTANTEKDESSEEPDPVWGYSDNATIVDEVNGVVQNAHSVYATGTIILTLTDNETGESLAGGTFDLYKDGQVIMSGLTTDKNGQIIVKNCEPGEYYFEETEAPDGYAIPDTSTTGTVTVESGLTQVKEYPLTMENAEGAVKYAVRIYGICADDYSLDGGDTTESVKASLTFGPATGASYLDTYVSCDSDTCIHKLSWDEIITLCEQNKGDESALRSLFGSCLNNGCTTSVKLNLNDTIGTGTTYRWSGDGTGMLYDSISSTYRKWNNTNSTTGYWPGSRMRATLNGKDDLTTSNSYVAGTDTLDADTCLFSCFPASLQSAIVPKVVCSGSGYTSYDRLWLFSENELWGYTSTNGGSQYEYLATVKGVTSSSYSALISYSEQGVANTWWPRSRYSSSYVYYVRNTGARGFDDAHRTVHGLSPGFCIK